MKTVPLLLCLLSLIVPAQAQSAAGGAAKRTPAAKKAEPPKPAEPVKLEGMEVARTGGGFLGVAIVGGSFKISFYDAQRKPAPMDVARALLRWDPKYKVGQERIVLNPTADGKALTAPKNIRPPYSFKLFITLLKEAAESAEPAASETYVIDFRA